MENLASPMKFAITGGAGFVGSNIAKKLVDEGKHQILIIDNLNSGELENLESINGKFEFFHVDIRDYDKMIVSNWDNKKGAVKFTANVKFQFFNLYL